MNKNTSALEQNLYSRIVSQIQEDPAARRRFYQSAAMKRGVMEPLVAVLHDESAAERLQAVQALAEMEEIASIFPGVLEGLRKALQDASVEIRREAARAILRMGPRAARSPRMQEALLSAAHDQDTAVAIRAVAALGSLLDATDVRSVLKQIARNEELPEVLRREARGILEERTMLDMLRHELADAGIEANRLIEDARALFQLPRSLRLELGEPFVSEPTLAINFGSFSEQTERPQTLQGEPQGADQPFYWTLSPRDDGDWDLVIETDDGNLEGEVFVAYLGRRDGEEQFLTDAAAVVLHRSDTSPEWSVGRLRVSGHTAPFRFERIDPEIRSLEDADLLRVYRLAATRVDPEAAPAWDRWLDRTPEEIRTYMQDEYTKD